MKTVETRGRSVEEAVASALLELEATEDQVIVEVLEEASKGILGFIGGKDARVLVKKKRTRLEAAEKFLLDVAQAIGAEAATSCSVEGGYAFIEIEGEDMGALIGRHGQTLSALQYLTNLVCGRDTIGDERIVVDICGYRKRREATLSALANRIAERVRRTRQSVTLEPMNAQERRIIHTSLQSNAHVVTKSEGEEPYRRVVVMSKR